MEDKLKVLAVDDTSLTLAMIDQGLREIYEVITVNSGIRAIQFLKRETADLVLLDVQMAVQDGVETLREIRSMENGRTIPVIMLTSKQDKKTIIECSKLGAYDYVLKPFDIRNLKERISRVLEQSGTLDMEDKNLYNYLMSLQKELWGQDTDKALGKLDQILRFQMDEEIVGRMRNARMKLLDGDVNGARRHVGRILKMLERTISAEQGTKAYLTAEEINEKLLVILSNLKKFKVGEASMGLKELLRFELPRVVESPCTQALATLQEYDDGQAEKVIKETLEMMKEYL